MEAVQASDQVPAPVPDLHQVPARVSGRAWDLVPDPDPDQVPVWDGDQVSEVGLPVPGLGPVLEGSIRQPGYPQVH